MIIGNIHCYTVTLTHDVLLVGQKTILPSFEEFALSLGRNSVPQIEEKQMIVKTRMVI